MPSKFIALPLRGWQVIVFLRQLRHDLRVSEGSLVLPR